MAKNYKRREESHALTCIVNHIRTRHLNNGRVWLEGAVVTTHGMVGCYSQDDGYIRFDIVKDGRHVMITERRSRPVLTESGLARMGAKIAANYLRKRKP